MAESSRFASPVNDATEEQFRLTRIPEKTKSATAWGIHVWSVWATARASMVETASHAPVGTLLLQIQVEDLAYWMSKKHERLPVVNIHQRPCTPMFAASSSTMRPAAFTTSIRLMILFKKYALTT